MIGWILGDLVVDYRMAPSHQALFFYKDFSDRRFANAAQAGGSPVRLRDAIRTGRLQLHDGARSHHGRAIPLARGVSLRVSHKLLARVSLRRRAAASARGGGGGRRRRRRARPPRRAGGGRRGGEAGGRRGETLFARAVRRVHGVNARSRVRRVTSRPKHITSEGLPPRVLAKRRGGYPSVARPLFVRETTRKARRPRNRSRDLAKFGQSEAAISRKRTIASRRARTTLSACLSPNRASGACLSSSYLTPARFVSGNARVVPARLASPRAHPPSRQCFISAMVG